MKAKTILQLELVLVLQVHTISVNHQLRKTTTYPYKTDIQILAITNGIQYTTWTNMSSFKLNTLSTQIFYFLKYYRHKLSTLSV